MVWFRHNRALRQSTFELFMHALFYLCLGLQLRRKWRRQCAHLHIAPRMAAFTLIELSIVLVIIGLIIGAVLVGQELIKAAEKRAIMSQKRSFEVAMMTFKNKYGDWPGDIPKAEMFFGSAGGDGAVNSQYNALCSVPASTNRGETGTCNGDGNRRIAKPDDIGANNERFFLWQHLALAGLIDGDYEGRGQGISYGHRVNYNSPQAPIKKGLWAIHQVLDTSKRVSTTLYDGVASHLAGKHVLLLAGSYQPVGTYWSGPVGFISPNEAELIDTKFDDGMPLTGRLTTSSRNATIGSYPSINSCLHYPTHINSVYRTSDGEFCIIIFSLDIM